MKKGVALIGIMITIFVILLSIGFAAFVDTLSINDAVAQVRLEVNTRISAVTTSSSYISNLNYNVNEIIGTASIPNNAAVTFNTTITTYGNVKMALSDIAVFNGNNQISNVTITPNLTNSFERICDNNNICTLNKSKTIPITVTNNTGSVINTDNFKVKLTYTPFYIVNYTYNNTTNSLGTVLENGTFTYEFSSNIPTSVTVTSGTCGTPQLTPGNNASTLQIANVMSDLVLTGTMGQIQDGTWEHPYELDDNTYHYADLAAASYIFTSLPGEPEITVDANHKVTKYEYKGLGTTGLALNSTNSNIDTGVLAFDGSGFTIHLEMDMEVSNQSGNTGKYIVSAMQKVQNNKYGGFVFWVYSISYFNINASASANVNGASFGQRAGYWRIDSGTHSFTWDFTYTPSPSKSVTGRLTPVTSGNSETPSISATNFPDSLAEATITLGGNGFDTSKNIQSMTVKSFIVTKN